jgi:hypothetical protein
MRGMASFYTEALGLRVVPNKEFGPDEWLVLASPGRNGLRLCLHKAGKPGSPPYNRNKLVFEVDDVGEARRHLIAKGVKMGTHHHWPGMDACDGRDPEGNAFQIAGPATKAKV